MSVVVVDRFEIVDVGHDDRERPVVAARTLEFLTQTIEEVAVVLEAGEPVGHRQRLQLGHRLFQFLVALTLAFVEATDLLENRTRCFRR